MRRRGAIRLPHGRRTQDSCIGFIEEYKYFRDTEISDRAVCKICHEKYPAVPTRTIRNWLKHFNPYGECPWETRIHKTRLSKVMRGFRTADDDVKNRVVLEIFEENPEYFLDEFVREFGIRTGRHLLSDAFWSTMGFLYRYVMMLQNIAMMKHELNTLQHCVNSLQIQIS